MIAFVITLIVGFPLGHAFSVSQPYYAVGGQGQVSLQCIINTRSQPEEMQVTIFKGMYGEEKICSAYVNTTNPRIETNGRVYCRGNVNTGKVDLTIFGLRGEDTDLYRCQVDAIFPPPYISKMGNGTLVYIPDSPDCPPVQTQARIQEIPKTTQDQTLVTVADSRMSATVADSKMSGTVAEGRMFLHSATIADSKMSGTVAEGRMFLHSATIADSRMSAKAADSRMTATEADSFPNILLSAILITTTITLILQVMKMILTRRNSNHLTQTISHKGDYSNFW